MEPRVANYSKNIIRLAWFTMLFVPHVTNCRSIIRPFIVSKLNVCRIEIAEFSTLGALSVKARLNESALLHCPSPASVPQARIEWIKHGRGTLNGRK